MEKHTNFFYVHGTGGRSPKTGLTLNLIRANLSQYFGPKAQLHDAPWGDHWGARLNANGASIPGQRPAPDDPEHDAEGEAAWSILYADPATEIRLLAERPGEGSFVSPGEFGRQCLAKLDSLNPPAEFEGILTRRGLSTYWLAAVESVRQSRSPVRELIMHANRDPAAMSVPISRLLLALTLSTAAAAGHPSVAAATRRTLIDLLVEPLGGPPLGGIGDFLLQPCVGLASALMRRNRFSLSNAAAPFAADILLYQSRGVGLRQFLAEAIVNAGAPVVILAHSLGGIACVDLLIERDLRENVVALVTVGSQAPLFFELNALQSLHFGQKLPLWFPPHWINFFDPSDFLSYIGVPVFGDAVKDIEINSGEPFPTSHSAYWDCDALWERLKVELAWI